MINTLYPPLTSGGAEHSVKILAEALQKKRWDVSVITLGDSNTHELQNGVSVYRRKLRNIYWPFEKREPSSYQKVVWHLVDANNRWMRKEVQKIAEDIQPDIIHTHNLQGFSTDVWKTGARLTIPVVHTLRDYWLRCPKTTMFRNGENCEQQCLQCRLLSIPKEKASSRVDGVIGISRFILDHHLNAGYFQNAVQKKVIYNSVEISTVPQKKSHGEFKAGFLGRISESKGIKKLVDIFKHSEIPLLIGGEGDKDLVDYIHQQNASNIH